MQGGLYCSGQNTAWGKHEPDRLVERGYMICMIYDIYIQGIRIYDIYIRDKEKQTPKVLVKVSGKNRKGRKTPPKCNSYEKDEKEEEDEGDEGQDRKERREEKAQSQTSNIYPLDKTHPTKTAYLSSSKTLLESKSGPTMQKAHTCIQHTHRQRSTVRGARRQT